MKVYSQFTQYIPLVLGWVFCAFFFGPHLDVGVYHDEIHSYFLPTLKLLEDWSILLPWNYDARNFFGHPPLQFVLYAIPQLIFTKSIVALRMVSLLASMAAVFALYEIGKASRGVVAGGLMVLMYISNISFMYNGISIYGDVLLNTFFLLLVLADVREQKVLQVVWSVLMILTRPTSLFVITTYWVRSLLNKKDRKMWSCLMLFQVTLFILYKLFTGNFSPLYNGEDDFFFDLGFLLNALQTLFTQTYWNFHWWLLFVWMFVCLMSARKNLALFEWRKIWPLGALPIIFLLGLSTIKWSLPRYQLIGFSSLAVFCVLLVTNPNMRFRRFAIALFTVYASCVFFLNLQIGHKVTTNFQGKVNEKLERCAERVKFIPLSESSFVGPFPLSTYIIHRDSILSFEYRKPKYERFREMKDYDPQLAHDYVIFLEGLASSGWMANKFKEVRESKQYEMHPSSDLELGCLVFKNLHAQNRQ